MTARVEIECDRCGRRSSRLYVTISASGLRTHIAERGWLYEKPDWDWCDACAAHMNAAGMTTFLARLDEPEKP